jgi:acyl transferase domain-containing protein/NADPH:quinone reductase-like Zn-dependent oxidoreductase/acyl carrier protein
VLGGHDPAAMSDAPIAIVGASCRFPGADGLEAFWRLLAAGGDAISEIDHSRWSTRFFYHPERNEPGKSYTWAAGLIDDIDCFEPAFFGISPREAAQMDPQQRLLLELVWHALEDAGIPPHRLAGTGTGVYVGASATDYSDLRLGDPAGADSYFMTGNTLSILANRVSYVFDLRGPSLTVDTACSSSLVALHHACEALRRGQLAAAIVGGVNLLLTPYPFVGFCRASMLSRRGRCYAFDQRADGYVRAEGGGVIVLKPLADALAAGDPIRAVILATGTNADGRTIGLSLPSEAAQASLLREVYARAEVEPDRLAFFEMHGTGTPAGDPVEAAAVGRALGQRRAAPLPIGSVKSNIGHLEPASGMAGLLKAALALDNEIVPPSLHCETPNPNIPFEALNLRLVRNAEALANAGKNRCAGVNSFGFGGTNAHVVLAPAPPRWTAATMPEQQLPPLLISAASEASLGELVASWRQRLVAASAEDAPALLRAAARGRDHHRHRLVALGHDRVTTASLLERFLEGRPAPELVSGTAAAEGKLAFVFSGNGAQFPGMGRTAARGNGVFRTAIRQVDEVLRADLGWSVAELVDQGVDAAALTRTDVAQPLLFAIQVGIVEALRAQGVVASAYLGHSVGEITAAWGAGALSLADAGRVVIARSRGQQRTQGAGRMAALALAGDAASRLLGELASSAEIAAVNAANSVTLSGSVEEIERLGGEARRRNLWFRPLDLDFAFHSAQMDPIRDRLLADLAGFSSAPPPVRLVSTVTGAVVDGHALDAEHWWRNIRNPVRFAEATATLIGEGYRAFLEIGPGAILQSYLTDGLRAADVEGRVLSTLSRNDGETDPFPTIAARCYVAGYDLAQARAFDGDHAPRSLPLYPWNRERFWFDKTVEAADPESPRFEHPLLGFRQAGPLPHWLNHLDQQVMPWIADHAVEGMPVFPAAAILETAMAAARSRWPEAAGWDAFDLEVRRPLPFDKGRMRELRTTLLSEDGDWELASRPRLSSEPVTVHAVGRIAAASDLRPLLRWSDEATAPRSFDSDSLYRAAKQAGLDYGPLFRTVQAVEVTGPDCAIVHLDPVVIENQADTYLLHPALLDGALQGLLALLAARHRETPVSYLPWRFARVRFAARSGRPARQARLRLTRAGVRSVSADISLYDETGALLAELADCWFRRVEMTRRAAADERMFRVDLVPAPLAELDPPIALHRAGAILARLAAAWEADRADQDQAPLLEALIGAVALQALQTLVEPGHPFTIGELIDSGRLAAGSSGLFRALLSLLERLGAAAETVGEWRLDPASELPEAKEIWRLLLAEAPELVAELALAAAALDGLPKTLAEGPKISQPQPMPMVEQLLTSSPASIAGVELLGDALNEIAAAWPRGRLLRILEIGAVGGTTRRVLDRLSRCEVALAYLAASADPEQTERLAATIQSFPGASACSWTPGSGTEVLGQAGFDIVLSVDACTRLQLDATALSALGELLAPGGLLIAIEPERSAFWEVAVGQGAGWWGYDGPSSEASPLCDGEGWRARLAASGLCATGAARCCNVPWPSAVFWGSARSRPAAANAVMAEQRRITLVARDTPLRQALLDQLTAAGHQVTATTPDQGAVALAGRSAEVAEVVLFVCAEADDDGSAAQRLSVLARLAHEAAERRAQLWVVTCGAQQDGPADGKAGTGLAGAALWGFARVLLNELPRLKLRLIDLAEAAAPDEAAGQVAAELASDTAEIEIAWTQNGRHVLRLRPGLLPRRAPRSELLTLASNRAGGFDALGWKPRALRALGPGEVEIEVHAAGLNFRDMMWALGLLPEEALIDGFAGPGFGLECAGIIRAVGPEVNGLAIGQRVTAFAPEALSTRVITVADAVTPISPELDFVAAATLPVTFVTAIYALGHLARLAAGEHVLIHSAAGGVGLAAIQYAKHRGATVIATAGSEVKRAFLRLAGADHVLDSRDLAFSDAVREITLGEGVDVVLNSLSGEAMERSLETVKPFGRFLELGKRDFYLNRRLHLRPLRQNISYFAIDVDQLPLRRPALARALLAEVSDLLGAGAIRPLAHRVFRFSEIDEALRLMQSSGHIGKLVLVPDGDPGIPVRATREYAARRDGTYLITGGLDGFGFETARWLAERGAGSIALMGRRGLDTPGCRTGIAELEAAGAEVRVYRGDVADRASLASVLDQIRAAQPPLRGIAHAAAVVADRLAADIDAAGIEAMLRPKLDGAVALDELTRNDPIELFLLFSSATTMLGAPGQGGYVAANMTLEALARRRRAEGRPGLAIAWGPIEDAGYLSRLPETRDALARRLGANPIPAAAALAGLPAMLASGLPVVGVAETNWNEARRFLPILSTPLFAELRGRAGPSAMDEALVDRLAALEPEAALALLRTVVAEEAARILRLPAGSVDPLRPLSQIGMDSLMAVELRLALESRLRIDLPLVSLAEGTSVASIAARLGDALKAGARHDDVAALTARYEAIDEAAPIAREPMAEPKSAAAE